MKKIFSLLAFVSLSLTATAATNASETTDEIVVFATHEVRVPRHTAAEKSIEHSLAEFRAQARQGVPMRVELPALSPIAQQQDHASEPTRQVAVKQARRDGARS